LKTNKPGPLFRDKFFGAPYKLCGKSKEEGFDCFSLIYHLQKDLGFDMPDGIDDVSATDYRDLWDTDEEIVKDAMWKYIYSFTDQISIGKVVFGDVIIFKSEGGEPYPGVFLGNGKIGACFSDAGVRVFSSEGLDLISARRFK